MGQKVNPIIYRLGIHNDWQSLWAVGDKKQYKNFLLEDVKLRQFLRKRLQVAGIVGISIERLFNRMKITLFASRPGVVIGRGGKGLELLKNELYQRISIEAPEKNLEIKIEEVKNPDIEARFVAERVANQLERRMPHRRVMRKELERVMSAGALGVKIRLAGRIDGVKISRQEKFVVGKVPTSTIRADIDYAYVPALTRKGYVGVKVWIHKES
ncbi:30S ribosomal protein S3 [Candidatus Shapirobacteria bacterium CG09_land_8_20_14_0_10_38_17]|uniref:Small ribosomal subunit protein uS3 n=1 Tax=Candidatus Shapirobacteria bacterium CG09_land_8_20_14_0_10_38_17 TaxID=1974884 RepID=A0A2H0WRX5_9BACT|nr:MAG: 30S ribosomal protein S3 [Candidatus Shapirobacteria bacterium CG09_land_8_20_14_0_10_38_17]